MLRTSSEAQFVTFSVRLYRALVAAYPAEFRREYGEPMVQAFRDSCRRAIQEGGGLALLALWGRIFVDTFKTILEEYANGGIQMTREKFIRLSGWALMLGALLLLVGWLASSRPEYEPYNYRSLPIDRYANLVAVPLISLGMALNSLGMAGYLTRFGRQAGGFGRVSLALGVLCGLISAVGAVGLAANDSDPWWSMFFLGWAFQSLFLALFGVASLRRRLLPHWNGLPILAGIWLPVMVVIFYVYERITGSFLTLSSMVSLVVILIMVLGMSGLGYLLQSQASSDSPATGAA
jgi:hypothetical protein